MQRSTRGVRLVSASPICNRIAKCWLFCIVTIVACLSILAFGARFFDPDVGLAKMLTLQQLLLQIDADRWQDVALSAGNIFFCFTLVPMLRHPDRLPLLTCIPTGLALLAGGFVFATLYLWLTALTQTITGLQWLALAFKKSRQIAPALPSGSHQI